MKKLILILMMIPSILLGQESLVDERDGSVYKLVEIGNQLWFAENLKFKTPGSTCYKKKKKNCEKRGRLYPYFELDEACPIGWSVPNVNDWETLKSNFSNYEVLDLMDKDGWENNEGHRNKSGFSLKGVGYQFKKRTFLGSQKATTIWINEMNNFAEYYHAHIYGGTGTYFEPTNYRTNEVFHAHPIENVEHRKFSIRCISQRK